MAKFKKNITITAKDAITASAVEKALKILLAKSDPADLIKISNAVSKNPGLVKQATAFMA